MNMHVSPSIHDDRDLIRLCKKTVEALKADLAALLAKEERTVAFNKAKPVYPVLKEHWSCSVGESSSRSLRETYKQYRKQQMSGWREGMREQIKMTSAWERSVSELRKSTGLHAAEIHENRTTRRAFDLMDRLLETPATTIYGAAHKAAVVHAWIDGGYGLDGRGEQLMLAILDEVRLLGTGGNNGGQIRVSHGIVSVERAAPEMADAA